MRHTLTALVLASMLWAGLWPLAGMAEEPLAITTPSGFGSFTSVSGLTNPRGVTSTWRLSGFPSCGLFIVEQSLNRVSVVACNGGPPTPFATGLSTPTDLVAAPAGGSGPFGNFLYVAEAGANRISRIDQTGTVTSFTGTNLPAAPKRMAFSPRLGAFGDFLFVTLANGTLVKVNSVGGVSTCAGGLSGPEGLVFAPGGTFFKNVLFVAEATGNRISKVDAACAVSPFASTGLSSPGGLAISPGGAWGPVDTLYVVNATTQINRVDKSGNVTPFASGFTQADTLSFDLFPFDAPPADRFIMGANLHVSDTLAGTIVDVFVFRPFALPQLVGCNPCRPGDTFAVSLTVRNQGPIDVPVEIKTGFRLPDGTPLNFSPLGNKHFEAILPKGFSFQGPWVSFAMPAVPQGRYCYEVGMNDPELFTYIPVLNGACFDVVP